jgi:hypothetical protein
MIICAECGHRNGNDESFCRNPSCGALLESEQARQVLVQPGARPADEREQGQAEALPPEPAAERAIQSISHPSPGPVVEPGQLACATCGGGNEPGRNFCVHCGASLTVPPTGDQAATTGATGPRPAGSERGLRLLLAALGVIVLVSAGVLLGLTLLRGGDDGGGGGTVTTVGGGVAAVPPGAIRVAASTQSGERVATNLIDGNLGTFWSRRVTDQFAAITFTFTQPVKLARVSIAAGASGTEFRRRHRPKLIQLQYGDGTTQTATLADRPSFQNVEVKPRVVGRLRIVIRDVYRATGGQNPRLTSISEIRFLAAR